MIISLSKPTDKEFHANYFELIPTLFTLSIIAQIISGLTEVGIIYNVIYSKLISSPFPISISTISATSTITALLGTFFFELGLRKFIPYSYRAILFNRWSNLEHKLVNGFLLVVSILLVSCSIGLSYNGSKELVNIYSVPTKESTIEVTKMYQNEIAEIKNTFTFDSLNVVDSYTAEVAAKETHFNGLVNRQQNEISLFELKEQKTGNSYATRKKAHKTNINKIESNRGNEIAVLLAQKRNELSKLSSGKKGTLKTAKLDYQREKGTIEKRNNEKGTAAIAKASSYGGGLAWFSVLAMIVFLSVTLIYEAIKKGSGITEIVKDEQTILSRLKTIIVKKVSFVIDSKVSGLESTAPATALKIPEIKPIPSPMPTPRPIVENTITSYLTMQPPTLSEPIEMIDNEIETGKKEQEQKGNIIEKWTEVKKEQEQKGNINICVNCSTSFKSVYKSKKYCSPKCKTAYYRSSNN